MEVQKKSLYMLKGRMFQRQLMILKGKPIVMVDDYDREFEGDIVLAAEKATEENLLLSMRHALMCLPCTQEN